MMSADDAAACVSGCLRGFVPTGQPVPLPGGNLNLVWRVPGEPSSVVVKFAPPFVASSPQIPLSADRLRFEAAALELFREGGQLHRLAHGTIRVPLLLAFEPRRHLLILQDLGDCPTLDELIPGRSLRHLAADLGRFIGQLHAASHGDAGLARRFDNHPVQNARNDVQYQRVKALLQKAGVPRAAALASSAQDLGKRLLQSGRCLTMGDLWPRSLLLRGDRLYVIDWELAHFGNPAQDVGHLLAHLWMLGQRASSPQRRRSWLKEGFLFLEAYGRSAAAVPGLIDETVAEDAAVHFGCELLARTVGPFQRGYLYEGLPLGSEVIHEAVTEALQHLVAPRDTDVFSNLMRAAGGANREGAVEDCGHRRSAC